MTHVMSFSSTRDDTCILTRFSASAPELSTVDDALISPSHRSYSVSNSSESLPRPPLIFVSTSPQNQLDSSIDNGEHSPSVDRRFLTTSQSESADGSITAPIVNPGSNTATDANSSQQQPQLGRQPIEPRTIDEVVVLGEALGNQIDELRRSILQNQRRARGMSLRGCWNALRGFFGYGPEGTTVRKEWVSLVSKLTLGVIEISVVIVLLALGAAQKSPVDPTLNEWQACNRPLGIWSALWCVRVVLGCFVAIWMYQHRSSRILSRQNQRNNNPADAGTQGDGVAGNPTQPAIPNNPSGNTQNNTNGSDTPSTLQHRNNSPVARLGSVLSLTSAVWFIVAHVFLYTSTSTCRLSAPHLWWLTFAIVCIGYIVVVELAVVIILIFILGPLLMLTINLILICLGREPLQLTSSQPKVGKLSLKAVDTIPLVLYIPAPVNKDPTPPKAESDTLISKPEATHVHSYPPQRDCPSPSSMHSSGTRVQSRRSKRWFTFRRVSPKKGGGEISEKSRSGDPYEDKWEKGEYPFVKLEENRAVCAICLCDFEEPKRVRYSMGSMPPLDQEEKGIEGNGIVESPTSDNEDDALRLSDAGGGAQPLRLLDCAHAFHKTCIDPWLTEVSGRCPVCQRPVEAKESKKKKERRT